MTVASKSRMVSTKLWAFISIWQHSKIVDDLNDWAYMDWCSGGSFKMQVLAYCRTLDGALWYVYECQNTLDSEEPAGRILSP